jgi:hypothetical protein
VSRDPEGALQKTLLSRDPGVGNVVIANGNAGKIMQTPLFPVAGSPRTGMLGFRWMF